MDGLRVAYLWGDFMLKLTSDGMRVGDAVRPYVFAPIATTGSLVVLILIVTHLTLRRYNQTTISQLGMTRTANT